MKISVLGAGAVGCMVAGLIKQHDPQVDLWLLARGQHADRMRESGHVELRGGWGTYRVPVHVCSELSDIRDSDYLLLTAKSTATEELLTAAQPYLGKAMLISLQNGINQHVLGRFLPASQFLVGITATNMSLDEPGVVSLHLFGPTVIGPTGGASDQDTWDAAIAVLAKSRLPMRGFTPIESIQYNKIALNTIGYTSAVSRSNFMSDCLLDRQWRTTIAIPMLDECFRVYEAAGIRLARTPGIADVVRLRKILSWLDRPLARPLLAWAIRRCAKDRLIYSVEQDLARGRVTEIDHVNGEIVRLATSLDLQAPYNQLTVDIVHQQEQKPQDRFLTQQEVIDRFQQIHHQK